MGQWEDRLLEVAWRNARGWAAENPIKYSIAFGAVALALQAAISLGVSQISGLPSTILSVLLLPAALVLFMVGRTLLDMLYEVREAFGEHVTPRATEPGNFTCELLPSADAEQRIRITNHTGIGLFYARVTQIEGAEHDPSPFDIRWRGDSSARECQISNGDREVLQVVRVRGQEAIDFLKPTPPDQDRYERVAAEAGAEEARRVVAHVKVFNETSDSSSFQGHLLELTFDNGADEPSVALLDTDDERDRGASHR